MSVIQHLQRNILIVLKIKDSPYINFKELTHYLERELAFRGIFDLGLSRRTIQRDIQNIRIEFNIDIEYCNKNKGYYISESDGNSNIERFLDTFDLFTSIHGKEGVPDYIIPETYLFSGVKHLQPIIYAIKNNLCVSFSYHKFGASTSTQRVVEPYAAKEYRGRWYLVGREHKALELKSFGLDRIKELSVTDIIYQKDSEVDIAQLYENSLGIYTNEKFPVEDVILAFDAADGAFLKSLPMHHSQQILKDDGNEFVIQLKIRVTPDFIMEIISRSWSVTVIQPYSLREEICKLYSHALERNSASSEENCF